MKWFCTKKGIWHLRSITVWGCGGVGGIYSSLPEAFTPQSERLLFVIHLIIVHDNLIWFSLRRRVQGSRRGCSSSAEVEEL